MTDSPNRLDKWWRGMAPIMRRVLGYEPPTREEAEQLMAEADEVPIGEEEIDRIVKSVIAEPDDD